MVAEVSSDLMRIDLGWFERTGVGDCGVRNDAMDLGSSLLFDFLIGQVACNGSGRL